MSRSSWALAEARRRGRLVRVAGEPSRFDGRSRFEPRLLPGAASAAKWAAVLAAAGMLVMAVEPARALAASEQAAHGKPQANQAADQVVLAPGSGFAGGKNAALVRSLQRRLDGQGYSPGPVDGRYGRRTENAVEMFQRARGLRVDGIAGPLTFAALRTTVLYPGTGYEGAGSSKVRGLQRELRRYGFDPGPIDGRYGPLTEGAVRHFQAAHGLRVDGIAGRQTLGELERTAGRRGHATPPAPGPRRTTPSRPRPQPKQTTKPPHPVRHPSPTSRPGGAGWPLALVLAGALALAALGSGAWLVDRRRRKRATVPEPEYVPGNGHAERPFDDPVAAELAFRKADERGDPAAASNLGVLLEHRGDTSGAEAAYRRADARGSGPGAFNLAGLLLDRGDVEGAISAYRRADQRGDATATSNLARLLANRGDDREAADLFSRAEQQGDANAAANLGALLERRGDLSGAEAAYRRADARGDADGAHNLGEMLETRGDLDEATAAYRRADQRGDRAAAAKLGMLLERQRDYPAALQAYARAEGSDEWQVAELAKSRAQALAFGLSLAEKGQR
jgi:peptidoglycan hydrolase-like protein with peptidoglycan-binding domain/tetratricopeptide (TPR) repeat protein